MTTTIPTIPDSSILLAGQVVDLLPRRLGILRRISPILKRTVKWALSPSSEVLLEGSGQGLKDAMEIIAAATGKGVDELDDIDATLWEAAVSVVRIARHMNLLRESMEGIALPGKPGELEATGEKSPTGPSSTHILTPAHTDGQRSKSTS